MSAVYVGDSKVRKWTLPRRPIHESDVQEMTCGHFQKKYDKVQGMIQQVGVMDELLSGKQYDLMMVHSIMNGFCIVQIYRDVKQIQGTGFTSSCCHACAISYGHTNNHTKGDI